MAIEATNKVQYNKLSWDFAPNITKSLVSLKTDSAHVHVYNFKSCRKRRVDLQSSDRKPQGFTNFN